MAELVHPKPLSHSGALVLWDSLELEALLQAIYRISALLLTFVHAWLEDMHMLVKTQRHPHGGWFSQCEVVAFYLHGPEHQSLVHPRHSGFSSSLGSKIVILDLFFSWTHSSKQLFYIKIWDLYWWHLIFRDQNIKPWFILSIAVFARAW